MVADLAASARIAARPEEFVEAPASARMAFLARTALTRWAVMDFARLSLWTPVAIGLGAGFYFGLKSEPDWRWGAGALLLSALAALLPSRAQNIGAALMLVALGFVAADWRTAQVYAPQLTRDLGIVETTGRIVSIEESARQRRYVLALESIEGVAAEDLPARARITWRGDAFEAAPGDRITVRAGLSPPPPPVAPGAFDFARQLYFQGVGAVGFAVSAPQVDPSAEKTRGERLAAGVEAMRLSLAQRITSPPSSPANARRFPNAPRSRCATRGWRICWRFRGCIWGSRQGSCSSRCGSGSPRSSRWPCAFRSRNGPRRPRSPPVFSI